MNLRLIFNARLTQTVLFQEAKAETLNGMVRIVIDGKPVFQIPVENVVLVEEVKEESPIAKPNLVVPKG